MATAATTFADALAAQRRSRAAQGYNTEFGVSDYYIDPRTGQPGNRTVASRSAPLFDATTGRALYTPPGGSTSSPASPENPFSVIRNPKNTGVDQSLTSALARLGAVDTANTKTLADYMSEFKRTGERARASLASEQGALEDIYNPDGLRGRIFNELDTYGKATRKAGDRAWESVLRDMSARQMGAGSTGLGSYMTRYGADRAEGIRIPLERDIADRRLQAESVLKNFELAGLGRSGDLSQRYLANMLSPIDAQNANLRGYLGNLGAISNIDLANTYYNIGRDGGGGLQFSNTINPFPSGGGYSDYGYAPNDSIRQILSGQTNQELGRNPYQDSADAMYRRYQDAGYTWQRQGNTGRWVPPVSGPEFSPSQGGPGGDVDTFYDTPYAGPVSSSVAPPPAPSWNYQPPIMSGLYDSRQGVIPLRDSNYAGPGRDYRALKDIPSGGGYPIYADPTLIY